MSSPEPWSSAAGWREFFDLLAEAVVVFDTRAHVLLANTAALRLLPCEAGLPVEQLEAALGRAAVHWIKSAASVRGAALAPPTVRLADGRDATLAWRRLDELHGALVLAPADEPVAPAVPMRPGPLAMAADGMRETIAFLWASPFPATLQDAEFRVVDANQAMLDFTGHARAQIVGRDLLELRPPQDWPEVLAARERLRTHPATPMQPAMAGGRLIDAGGRERRYRVARRVLIDATGQTLYLAVYQDATAEHLARERAERSLRELDDWFDLSPVGMVLSDERGLLLRTNPAFDALVGAPPGSLTEAPVGLRELLASSAADEPVEGPSQGQGQLPGIAPDSPPLRCHGWITPPGQPARLLRVVKRHYQVAGGQRRTMAVIEDRSVEEERDLAQLQIGALIDTAGVGLATFQESSGWVRQALAPPNTPPNTPSTSAALHAISREIVVPESLAEFERLQKAIHRAERAEVRYAIQHPELGPRWLHTRVEPATLASGKRSTSVVTLDITEQHQTQLRTERLLHELSTILESTSAGIGYIRDDRLVRCNSRFEAMLGFGVGTLAGRTVHEIFGTDQQAERITGDALQALAEGAIYETEFDRGVKNGGVMEMHSYSLSVRRASAPDAPFEAIAALADVTRLKDQQRAFERLARDSELMFGLSGVGIAFLREGSIQRANSALAHLVSCAPAELAALRLSDLFVDGAEYARHWPLVDRSLREQGRWTGERQLRTRDGRLLWVQISKRLVTAGDPAGGIIASYVNVDARYRAERAVAQQADRTRAILDSVLVGIVTVGPQGIEWMNRSARRMFGGDLADFVSLPIATVATVEADHPFRRTEYLTELVEGQAETFECRVMGRDGRTFWVVGNVVSTERDSAGRQLTYALLDIERRREADARVSQAQAQLQRIIEAAPLAITLRDARTLKVLQVNEVAAASAGPARAVRGKWTCWASFTKGRRSRCRPQRFKSSG